MSQTHSVVADTKTGRMLMVCSGDSFCFWERRLKSLGLIKVLSLGHKLGIFFLMGPI